MKELKLIAAFIFAALVMNAQNLTIDGYVYESGNRGFLNVVQVDVLDDKENVLATVFSDVTGHFVTEVPVMSTYVLKTYKDMFKEQLTEVSAEGKVAGDKVFVKLEMNRAPGYIFEITIAESREADTIPVDAIQGARIEVYNNTTKEEVLAFVEHPHPHFDVALIKGNHYTLLIRKDGYLSKRMEAFVDVEGCILCFEGIGSVEPGVSDNLTEGNQMGVLLANVDLEKIYEGKTIPISNILYEYASSELDRTDEDGLKTLATLMSDNPDLTVEIGSHTDSRGKQDKNLILSQERAKNVIDFLVEQGVDRTRLVSRGYGESQLLNDCTSFVECTENEHRINRRTELKVLGIASVKAPVKTLAHIKQLEQSEALLEEIQFGGQVQIPSDEGSTNLDSIADAKAKLIPGGNQVKEAVEKIKTPEVDKPILEEGGGKMMDENTMEEKSSDMEEKDMEKTNEVAEENPVDKMAMPEGPLEYKILIHSSETQLSRDHDLYQRHAKLDEKKKGDQYYYLLGSFTEVEAVEKYYNTAIKLAYPEAKIVILVDGVVQ